MNFLIVVLIESMSSCTIPRKDRFLLSLCFIHFLQELMDVGSSKEWAKAPPCIWSPIPPPELRGELFEDLSTNGGFVSFGILLYHYL